MNRRALGRGLSALLGSHVDDAANPASEFDSMEPATHATVVEVPVALIDPNPYQPRSDFDPVELEGLADSIRLHGVLQPIVVRPVDGRYQLVAGERRLRAAQHLSWTNVPARVVELDERQTCELALVENLQRKDLNAVEKARAFQRYIEQFGATHDALAGQLGVDRSTVTNLIRLLELPDAVQEMVVQGKISAGHARSILSLDDPLLQLSVANEVAEKGLSVRQTESLVRTYKSGGASPTADAAAAPPESVSEFSDSAAEQKSNHIASIESELCQKLGLKVAIQAKGDRGRIVLTFESNDDFERAVEQLRR
jgi:ParB family chromosome partitioning protein